RGGLPLLGGAGEIDAAELDAIPARRPRDAEEVRQRRRVESPGVEREHHRHGLVAGAGLVPSGGLALANATASFTSASACLTRSSALTRCPPKWCSARSRCRCACSRARAAAWIWCSPARVAVGGFLSWEDASVPRTRTH